MGGSSKSQTVGYRYALGAHLALCHGPVDAIREIRVDDKTAWSIGSGASGAAQGAGVGAQVQLGTVAAMSAAAAVAPATLAQVQFPGTLAGVRLGQSYDLSLAGDGTTRRVTLRGIVYDASLGRTTWSVEPATTAFPAQAAAVAEAASSAPSLSGATGGRIRIDKPDLFGGESREGGIVGDIDVLMGGPDQGQNDYLAARAGAQVPAYRGIASLVLRQVALGLNPYLKPWAVRLTRIFAAEDGALQWYPAKAAIVPVARISDAAIYITLDASGSMLGTRMAAQIAAVSKLIAEIGANAAAPNDIEIVTWSDAVITSITRRNADAAAYAALVTWVEALPTATEGGTNFGAGVSGAAAFFAGAGSKRRILVFVTDGAPSPASTLQTAKATLAGISALDVFAFNIALTDTSATAELDTTQIDGVPVVPPGDPDALVASFRGAFGAGPDMNPAHIIRECLTNRIWGLGYGDADIGPSFVAAADALYAEGFGLSLLWQRDASIEEFLGEVLTHIDAHLYVDRRSGRWELRLIRSDYDPATLAVFDDSNVIDWGELGRREAADLVNSVTVTYADLRTDATGSVSVTDTALVQLMGQIVGTTVDYPGIRHESLAVRVAERDLRALSAPLLSGEITVTRAGAELDPGEVIRLVSPRLGLEGVAVRVVEIDHGDGRANGVRLKIAEDVFALGETALVGGVSGDTSGLTQPPKPLARRLVEEAPYWLLVQELGHTQTDALLTDDPGAGAILAAGERPSADALSARLWTDFGTGYTFEQANAFVPTALLAADASDNPEDRDLVVTSWTGLDHVTTGTLAALGGEYVRIDGVSTTGLTVGRGCLDTIPTAHAAGTPIVVWQQAPDATAARFAAGETVAVKLLPETGLGTLPLAQAPEDPVTFASRAIRPLPPGNVRADGGFAPLLPTPEVALTWCHRDRLAQTNPVFDDYLSPDIGPEPGVTYELRLHWVDKASGLTLEPPAVVIALGTATSHALTEAAFPVPPYGVEMAAIRLRAMRDGHEDRTFREYRVLIGGKVQVTDQHLLLLFTGPGVDLTQQDLVLMGLGPSVDILHQDLILDSTPAALGVLGQELVVEFTS